MCLRNVKRAQKKAIENRELSMMLMAKWSSTLFKGKVPVDFDTLRISFNDLFPLICDGHRSYRAGTCHPDWREF